MDNKENIDTRTRQYDNFDKSVWKTDDKTWMKDRRAGWSSIKNTLDHMFEHNRNIFRDKKPYKYIKQFYLTGSIDFPEEVGGISYITTILNMNSPLDMWEVGGDIGGLLECWLTPEPSQEKWEQIFERYEVIWVKRKEPENVGSIFEQCRVCYRNSLVNWYTEQDQVSLFGDLEQKLSKFFKLVQGTNKFFKHVQDTNDDYFCWESLLPHLLKACGWEGGYGNDGQYIYHPDHPVYIHSDQIIASLKSYYDSKVKWILKSGKRDLDQLKENYEQSPDEVKKYLNYDPNKLSIEEFFYNSELNTTEKYTKKYNKKMAKIFSFIYYIANSSNIFHAAQVAFANKIIKGIEHLDLPDNLKKSLRKGKNSSVCEKKIKKLMKQYNG